MGAGEDQVGTTELDSHANMVVLGNQATIIQSRGTADVNAFSEEVGTLKVPIVDGIIAYD